VSRVTLRENLTSVPQEILEYAPWVEFLDLSSNQLCDIPDWIGELANLKVLFLSNNRFTEVPRALRHCRALRMLGMRANQIEYLASDALPASLVWLTLTDNYIQILPDNLGRFGGLQKLLLAGNQLSHLPESLRGSITLELLRISANTFEVLPDWLFELPALAWLAIAGNPCSAVPRQVIHSAQTIPWGELVLMEELGRGASGPTYRARHVPPAGDESIVAVKVFSSSISSDGDAHDEIAAALRAGQHPHLVSTKAALSDHPEGRVGLVLDLVPDGYKNLAAPPSFESVTRDVYQTDSRLTYNQALRYASGIAQAAAHLHRNGILHGDLYSHNTLVCGDSAILGDFGAACLYAEATRLPSALVERIELRAFGILLSELVELVSTDEEYSQIAPLRELARRCMADPVSARPGFDEVVALLENRLHFYGLGQNSAM
jgi:hypothetical protein